MVPLDAWAIDDAYAELVATCGFPMAVSMNNNATCQGTYIGGGLVVTVAHCVDEGSENPAQVQFGDEVDVGGAEIIYEEVACDLHPTWDGEEGVDLAICDLSTNMFDVPIPDVPEVYPTPPGGCEVAYLRYLISPTVTGCNSPPDSFCHDGIPGNEVSGGPTNEFGSGAGPKRQTDSVIVYQRDLFESPYMLITSVPGSSDQNLVQGDSGAPFYMQMVDGSWRVIGVHSLRYAGTMYTQAIPPYQYWLTEAFGIPGYDITPCHNYSETNGWVYDPGANCQNQLMTAADTPNATWAQDCRSSGDFGGGRGGCAGWLPPLFSTSMTPYLLSDDYDDIVDYVFDLVRGDDLHCNLGAIEDAIVLEGEWLAGWPILDDAPLDHVGLYEEAPSDAQRIYNSLCD